MNLDEETSTTSKHIDPRIDRFEEVSDSIGMYGVDLYLPLMSLLTLNLMIGFELGTDEEAIFDPAIIGTRVMMQLTIWILEALVFRFGKLLI